jgi:hypothetical protein
MIRNLVLIVCVALSCPALGSEGVAPITNDPPKDVSISNIIQSFAAKEKDFREAREQYTYTQDVTVRASCKGDQTGVYHLIVDAVFDHRGKRSEKVKAVDSTLQCVAVTKEDVESFRNQSLLPLTTDEIQDYQINFVGQQQQDDLRFYVFDVAAVAALPGKHYFEGRIWVDSRDFIIVKSRGTFMTKRQKMRKGQDNLLPAMTTWREQIDGRYWFPTQSRASELLHFSAGDVQLDEVIRFTNYKATAHSK